MYAPRAMAKSGGGVARLRCAPLVAVVQAADLWNGDHTSRIQRRDSTWKGESVTIIIEPRDGSIEFSDRTALGYREEEPPACSPRIHAAMVFQSGSS